MVDARRGHRAPMLPALALLLNAFVWGISWWPFRSLRAQGVHPLWATALIYIIAVAAMLAWRPAALRAFARHPGVWVLLFASGTTNVGFNWAVTVGDVVRVVLLFYLMPAWTVVLAWPLLGERPTPGSLLRLAVAMTGVFVVMKAPEGSWPVPQGIADWLAIAGGFSFALTNVMLRRLHDVPAPTRVLAMFSGGAFLAASATVFGMGAGLVGPLPPPSAQWIGLGLLLSLAFLAGNLALQYGAARIDAQASAVIMLAEIVFASLSSVALGAADLTPRTLFGGALILAAGAGSAWAGSKPRPSGAQSPP